MVRCRLIKAFLRGRSAREPDPSERLGPESPWAQLPPICARLQHWPV